MRNIKKILAVLALCTAFPALAHAQEVEPNALEIHLGHMITGSGQWRTPVEGYDSEHPNAVIEFGADYVVAPDRSRITAEIIGLTEDGRRAVYWTMFFFYNPVTNEVVSSQVGWSGAYLAGSQPFTGQMLQNGDTQIYDQVHYYADGTVSNHRHEIVVIDDRTHTTQTYSQDENGEWQPNNFRTWTLVVDE